ncbi:MAG: low temperature requirement protein A [Luteitalea sp.]|nr:low temperature requirement protein A [Luteitalea sp.]
MSRAPEQAWRRPMVARSASEPHRPATTLELFFDLCFVVAVAQASSALHHALAENHVGHGVVGFLLVFFAIWWAWMNFTWFASAYDTDDVPYRVATLIMIAGALVLAAGVPRAFASSDFAIITLGYIIMRVALVANWLRAARSDVARRSTALRYAAGVSVLQVGWALRLTLPDHWLLPGFLVLAAGELLVPVFAERAATTTWHPQHIAERYGLFTIIVLGESVLAAAVAVQSALDAGHNTNLLTLAAAGAVIVFSMWWLYFDEPAHELLTSLTASLRWGYGHYLIFASAAASGAGLAVAVDYHTGDAHIPAAAAGYATALPVATYLFAVWMMQIRPRGRPPAVTAYPVIAALVVATPFGPSPIHLIALLLAVLVGITVVAKQVAGGPEGPPSSE